MNNNKNEVAIQWFSYAQGDLKSATALLGSQDIPLRNVCYFAQQSVEKSFKTLLIFFGLPVIRTHDLDVLVNNFPNDVKNASTPTTYRG